MIFFHSYNASTYKVTVAKKMISLKWDFLPLIDLDRLSAICISILAVKRHNMSVIAGKTAAISFGSSIQHINKQICAKVRLLHA